MDSSLGKQISITYTRAKLFWSAQWISSGIQRSNATRCFIPRCYIYSIIKYSCPLPLSMQCNQKGKTFQGSAKQLFINKIECGSNHPETFQSTNGKHFKMGKKQNKTKTLMRQTLQRQLSEILSRQSYGFCVYHVRIV